ncbi:hypothetical protein G6K86_32290 [Agrobacterium rhizogenes]|nr:hypothetical protein [Rhizobium rhizogenes]
MVANALAVTPPAARRIIGELGLSEMAERGRFWAWGAMQSRLSAEHFQIATRSPFSDAGACDSRKVINAL